MGEPLIVFEVSRATYFTCNSGDQICSNLSLEIKFRVAVPICSNSGFEIRCQTELWKWQVAVDNTISLLPSVRKKKNWISIFLRTSWNIDPSLYKTQDPMLPFLFLGEIKAACKPICKHWGFVEFSMLHRTRAGSKSNIRRVFVVACVANGSS